MALLQKRKWINCRFCNHKLYRAGWEIKARAFFYCSNKCKGEYQREENNSNWNNGSSRLPYDKACSPKFKEDIRNLDRNCCSLCLKSQSNQKRKLTVHHIDGNKKNSTKENCITLCTSCHIKVENYYRQPKARVEYIKNLKKIIKKRNESNLS